MNIFVAGLSFKANDADLANIFEEYGEVSSARVITDRMSGRSKGYGFVVIEDEEAASRAINELNGAEIDGRALSVSEARPREEQAERPRREFNRSRGNFSHNRY
ncbi:MAG: RNA-binding protein [Dysgonamonadaceae bacterium]|jgi:RNA recognition motif-containing protein|nr:RNA-binding protein [Dysgonamonadaceae bacterium]